MNPDTAERGARARLSLTERAYGRWGMSVWRMLGIAGLALSFVGASAHQVVKRLDDWPLSAYQMYPHIEGKLARRNRLVGVSPAGEFAISGAHIGPLRGRIQYLMSTYRNRPKQLRKVLNALQREYEDRKSRGVHEGPVLQGLRMYSEKWTVQQGLLGVDKPRRSLRQAVYVPPLALLDRWSSETKDPSAATLPLVRAPAGDIVLDARQGELRGAARLTGDEGTALDGAVLLDATKAGFAASGAACSVSLKFAANAGTYALWVRAKSGAGEKGDSFWLALDGQQLLPKEKQGAGNFRSIVPPNAYVWVSHALERPPITVKLSSGAHELTLSLREGPLTVDQIWLSRSQMEAPDFNARVSPP